jgi:YHS domain-containing protein
MRTFGIALLVALFAVAAVAAPKKPQANSGLTCPVSNEVIKDLKKAPSVQYEGRTIYFCCKKCVGEFNSNPAKYAAKQEVRCPVDGEVVKDPAKAPTSTYQGKVYYFGSSKCKAMFDKQPAKFAKQQKDAAPSSQPEHSNHMH